MRKNLLILLAIALPGASGIGQVALASPVPGLVLTQLSRLPSPPSSADAGYCQHLLITPATDAGVLVRDLGWVVTAELKLGPYDAVSFAGGFEAGTSGSCRLIDGNVGIFEGDRLRHLVYAKPGAEIGIGRIEPFETTGIRIWNGDFLPQPIADLHHDQNGTVSLEMPAALERFCEGEAEVPNIYGMPIAQARSILAGHGWLPFRSILPGQDADPRSQALLQEGMTEVETCFGTGFGYCSFLYEGQFARLSVTSVGDGEAAITPPVAGYAVACALPGRS